MLDASSSSGFTPEDFQFFRKPLTSLDRAFASAAHTVADLVSDRDVRDLERLRATCDLQQAVIRRDATELEQVQLERDEALETAVQLKVDLWAAQRSAAAWKDRHDQEVRAARHVDLRGMAVVVAEVVQRQLAAHGVVVTEAQARDAANNAMQAIAGVLADSEAA